MSQRGYCSFEHGQLHYHQWPGTAPLLLCLHPVPYSGSFFSSFADHLASRRAVIAPDLPGYGLSDPPPGPPAMEDYGKWLAELLDSCNSEPVEVLGFHTGCWAGLELAQHHPEQVRQLWMVDAPAFDGKALEQLQAQASREPVYDYQPDCLAEAYRFSVTRHQDKLGVARGMELFIASLQAGTRQNWGLRAAAAYDWRQALKRLSRPLQVLATNSPIMLEPTRAVAAAHPPATFVHRSEIDSLPFERHVKILADRFSPRPARATCRLLSARFPGMIF